MDGLKQVVDRLCGAELDRLTAAEICLDECLTIMDRHRVEPSDPGYSLILEFSRRLHGILTETEGPRSRRERLVRVRQDLTEAFPLSDADLLTPQ
jgi:hypothetical protein